MEHESISSNRGEHKGYLWLTTPSQISIWHSSDGVSVLEFVFPAENRDKEHRAKIAEQFIELISGTYPADGYGRPSWE